jgi:large subunit ribosomal protein L18e
MANKTGSSNPHLSDLIAELKKKAIVESSPFWKRIASDLEKSSRNRNMRIVNLSRLNRFTKENETVIVPGKVLGSGSIDHKITVVAFMFSGGAADKLKKQNCGALSIYEFISKKPKTSEVRIMG